MLLPAIEQYKLLAISYFHVEASEQCTASKNKTVIATLSSKEETLQDQEQTRKCKNNEERVDFLTINRHVWRTRKRAMTGVYTGEQRFEFQ
jgi:hypothetical protein